jgi:hypothetical protein
VTRSASKLQKAGIKSEFFGAAKLLRVADPRSERKPRKTENKNFPAASADRELIKQSTTNNKTKQKVWH